MATEELNNIKSMLSHEEFSHVDQGLELLAIISEEEPHFIEQLFGTAAVNQTTKKTTLSEDLPQWPHIHYIQLWALCWQNKNSTIDLIPDLHLDFDNAPLQQLPPHFNKLPVQKLIISKQLILDISSLAKMTSLTSLHLEDLPITDLPTDATWKQLTSLSLRQLQIEEWQPPAFPCLEELSCSDMPLQYLPMKLFSCHKVKTLELNALNIKQIPEAIGSLHNLEKLVLQDLPIIELPPVIADLPHLRYLDLSKSTMTTLPDAIWQKSSLHTLQLSASKLETLPILPNILPNLKILDIADTEVKDIPSSFLSNLTKLEQLRIGSEYLQKKDLQPIVSKAHPDIDVKYTWSSGDRSCCWNCCGGIFLLILPFLGIYYFFFQ